MSAILIPSRRGVIAGLASLFAAPAVIVAPSPVQGCAWWIEECDNGSLPFIVNAKLDSGAWLRFGYRTIDEAIERAPKLARMASLREIA